MTADDDDLSQELRTLTPPPPERATFWAEVHELLALEAAVTGDETRSRIAAPSPTGRSRRVVLVIAAALAIVGGGAIVWLDAVRTSLVDPTERNPVLAATPDVVIDDPRAIDLDPWSVEPALVGGPFTVVNISEMSDGWIVAGVVGGHDVSNPDPVAYYVTTRLEAPDGQTWSVLIERGAQGSPANTGDTVAVRGSAGVAGDSWLTWNDTDHDLDVTIFSDGATNEELVQVAEALRFSTVDQLPPMSTTDETKPIVGIDAELGGLLDGQPWQLGTGSVTDTGTPTGAVEGAAGGLSEYIDNRYVGGRGGGSTAPSNGSDHFDVNLSGLGQHGVLIYGTAPSDIEALHVELRSGVSIQVPVQPDPNDVVVYAVPVPPGLPVDTIAFINHDHIVRHRMIVPTLPTPAIGSLGVDSASFGDLNGAPIDPG